MGLLRRLQAGRAASGTADSPRPRGDQAQGRRSHGAAVPRRRGPGSRAAASGAAGAPPCPAAPAPAPAPAAEPGAPPPPLRPRPAGRPLPPPHAGRPAPAPRRRQGRRPAAEAPGGPEFVTLRGPSAAVAKNMNASLELPTATSVRAVPVKLLFDNRIVINNHLKRARGGKISFTHLIGYAMVQAIKAMPSMNYSFAEKDGKPTLVKPEHVNFGLAIDLVKPNGDRQLVVAGIKKAETLNFFEFWQAYEDIVRRARDGKLTMDDFTGVTVSLTNPGGLGTVHSVPRLMPGQSVIMGVGSMDYPAEFQGTSQDTLNKLGISKVMTLTSTYDHRVIQGAASGEFLRIVANLLLGENGFYDEIFEALRIPYEPVRWLKDIDASHDDDVTKAARVFELIHSYRVRGHVMADTDPLEYKQRKHPDLDITEHGLTLWDLEREFAVGGFAGKSMMKLRDILGVLRDSYCRTTGVEFMHIQDPKQRKWIQDRIERAHTKPEREEQLRILRRLNAAEAFETFLQTKYVGQKRFSLEGGESVIPLLDAVIDSAAESRLDEVVIGMAHRGRLNVLANIVGKSYAQIFREFEGNLDPKSMHGSGDVKYHLGAEGTFTGLDGEQIKVSLAANPSHLEAVDPVLEGIARAKQDIIDKGGTDFTVLPVALHGDAAFAGQGVVAETLNMSQLRGYRTGGTVHIVINNQVGFTAPPESARSSMYSTDVARMIEAPIFHVNGDDPEAVVRVARLAFEFRQAFNKDVVIDLICYRRRGHNETDNPSFTNPQMYSLIDKKRSVRKLYTESLIGRGDITLEEAEQALQDFQGQLEKVFAEVREAAQAPGRGACPAAGGRVPGPRGHRGLPGGREADRRVAGQHPRPHHRPPASDAADAAPRGDDRGRHDRLGHGRDPRHRLAADGGHPGPAVRPGLPPRHVRPAPRGPGGPEDRRGLHPAAVPLRRPGPLQRLRLAALRVRGDGLRVRLLAGPPRGAGPVGGAVRRLRQRRADGRGRVHLLGGAEVGPDVRRHAAAAARLRGPGPGPLVRPPGALPPDVRAEQHDGRHADPPVELLPPAALAGPQPAPQAAGRLHPEVDAASEGGGVEGGGVHHAAASARSSATRRRWTRRAVRKVVFCAGKVYYDLEAERQEARRHGHGDHPHRAPVPAAGCRAPGGDRQVPERREVPLGPGGAGEPGRLAVHRPQPDRPPGPGGRRGHPARRAPAPHLAPARLVPGGGLGQAPPGRAGAAGTEVFEA